MMPTPDSTAAAQASKLAEPHAPLGAIAASGFSWNMIVTIVTKLLGIVTQVVLARLLLPEEFGAYTKALIVMAFATLPRESALPQVLMHRQKNLAEWVSPAFWMSLALGILSGAIMAVAGAVIASRPDGLKVATMLWIAAAGSPIIAIGIVPGVMLESQLQFKRVAQIGVAQVLVAMTLTIVMAAMGFGAYSLMAPQVLAACMRALWLLHNVRPQLQRHLELSRWIQLAHDGALNVLYALGNSLIGYGDYITLASWFSTATLGHYFFAFNLSVQTLALIAGNLSNVLLATLSRLNDERTRQVNAYLRALAVLTAVGMPIYVLQALLARPVVLIVFGARWVDSIPLLQILSLGMAFAMTNNFCGWLMQSQGRFRTLGAWTLISSLLFLVFMQIGVRAGGVMGVAVAVSAYHLTIGSIGIRVAIAAEGSWMSIVRMFSIPAMACLPAGLPVILAMRLWPEVFSGNTGVVISGLVLGSCAVSFFLIYAIVLRTLARGVWDQLIEPARAMLRRRMRPVQTS